MIDHTWSRAWCIAVGPRLDRGVRRPCSLTKARLFGCLHDLLRRAADKARANDYPQEAGWAKGCLYDRMPELERRWHGYAFSLGVLWPSCRGIVACTERARPELPYVSTRLAVRLRPWRPERGRPATAAQQTDCPAAGTAARSASNHLTWCAAWTKESQRWRTGDVHVDRQCSCIRELWSPNVRANPDRGGRWRKPGTRRCYACRGPGLRRLP
jgi:hypothetical protein